MSVSRGCETVPMCAMLTMLPSTRGLWGQQTMRDGAQMRACERHGAGMNACILCIIVWGV